MTKKLIKFLKSLIIFLMFVVVFAIGFSLFGFFKDRGDNSESSSISNDSEYLFLLAGVDSTGEDLGTRTDTLMLVKLNLDSKNVDMISIPRDSYVNINGSYDKINAAHSYGGIDLTMEVVRDFLGINLDKYLVVSFEAVIAGIDALGGMDVEIPEDVAYAMGKDPGVYKLSGKEVLDYVRFRKGYQNADLGRINTQQDFLKQFIKEMTKPANIKSLPKVYSSMKPYIKTNIGFTSLAKLALKFRNIDSSDINSTRLEGEPTDIEGISYFIVSDESILEIRSSYLSSFLRN